MDTGTRRGYTTPFHTSPMMPGVESAGTVVAVSDGVTNVKVGDPGRLVLRMGQLRAAGDRAGRATRDATGRCGF
jgi:NADPH:quinone reductase-like Zn-dependent oxidoreductase